ncbi:hypothetical protein O181_064693 [Austropuccinia psidii MF-1]|uniref:Uncharacterized protein n=1 Tax=Austropuccinia psidii MF-1 TaxID=1389203 RepID=A0A9Q3I1V7_9BASI|nr:hypothetical protein [Austropuccinia psidii MF-1]
MRKLRGNQLQAQVAPNKPSHPNEPSIPGPSQSSKPHEDALTHEPEAEVAPTQSMEEPFDKSSLHFFYSSQLFLTPPSTISSSSHYTPSVIIIDDTPIGSPLPFPPRIQPPPPAQHQAPLNSMMRLGRNLWTFDQPS